MDGNHFGFYAQNVKKGIDSLTHPLYVRSHSSTTQLIPCMLGVTRQQQQEG